MRHSKAYHDYFEDYAELEALEEGKRTIQRVYIGKWYSMDKEKAQRLRRKLAVCALFVLAAAAFVLGSLAKLGGTLGRITGLLQGVTAVVLLFLLVTVIQYAAAPEKMTIFQYRESSEKLKRISCISMVAFLVLCLCTVFGGATAFAYAGAYLAGAALSFCLFYTEKKLSYLELPPTAQRMENSSRIRKYTDL